jgi:hypothetical protein
MHRDADHGVAVVDELQPFVVRGEFEGHVKNSFEVDEGSGESVVAAVEAGA